MSVYVSHNSALWYWRHAGDYPRTLANRCGGIWSEDLPDRAIAPKVLESTKGAFGWGPVHLLAPSAYQRPQKTKYVYHVCSRQLPSDAFCCFSDSVYIASPELCLAQKARSLTPSQIAELSMEFMGLYAMRDGDVRGFATRSAPLVKREDIMHMLHSLVGKRRCSQIASLLDYAEQGSRSPMETREYLLMFLPKKYGGYGLPRAKMNAVIELTQSEQQETGRHYVECDLFWPEHNIAVEYDGDVDHASFEDRARDAAKRNVLQARGIRQFTITARQVFDVRAFDAVVHNIANAVNYNLRAFPGDWEGRRDCLRADLFKSLKSE